MPGSDFISKQFVCAICGDSFEALTSVAPPVDVVCNTCGLRYSTEKRKRLIAEKKAKASR